MSNMQEFPIIVQKFGGTSVATTERLKSIADRVVRRQKQGYRVVVVVSAMGNTTDDLIFDASKVSKIRRGREMDMLLTAGERISMSLLSLAIQERGGKSAAFTGSQAGIITDENHGKAKIVRMAPHRVQEAIDNGIIAIVAGFQGVSEHSKDVTTLGRGGSDTTAVALAAALGAEVCEIYTDVDGVYTADPRLVPTAKKIQKIHAEEMLELAASGAGILQTRSVEFGRNHGVTIHVRSSFSQQPGTMVYANEEDMENAIVTAVAHDRSEAKLTIRDVPDRPGISAEIFTALADANVNVDMIVQNVSDTGLTDMTFTLPETDIDAARLALSDIIVKIQARPIEIQSNIGKVSLIGAGMKTNPGVAARMFRAIAEAGINIEVISTSTIRVSVVVAEADLDRAVQAIHTAFGLDGDVAVEVEGSRG